MEWAKLVVDALKALAWPIVAFLVVRKLHPNFRQLAERLKKFKSGDHEIEFHEVPKLEPGKTPKVDSEPVSKSTDESPPEVAQASAAEPALVTSLASPAAEPALVEYAPAGAVVNAWARLYAAMQSESDRLGIAEGKLLPPRMLITRLANARVIDDTRTEAAALQMLELRNRTVHGNEVPTWNAATQFVETIEELIRRVTEGADRVRLRQILSELQAKLPEDVRFGPLRANGAASTEEGARQQLDSRLGKWAAVAGGITMLISPRDAALLAAMGARQVRDPEAERRGDFGA